MVGLAEVTAQPGRRGLAAIGIAVALTGCGWDVVPATDDELSAPWRPMPMLVAPEMRAEFDAACLADQAMPDGLSMVVMDARGEGRLVIGYADADADADAGGSEAWLQATIGAEPPSKCQMMSTSQAGLLPLGERELRVTNNPSIGDHDGWWSVIAGQAGADIAQVVAEVPGSPRIVATLNDGWFALWWPQEAQPAGQAPRLEFRLVGVDRSGAAIAEVISR